MSEPRRAAAIIDRYTEPCVDCGGAVPILAPGLDGRRIAPATVRCDECAAKRIEESKTTLQRVREERADRERQARNAAAVRDLDVPKLFAGVTLDTYQLHGEPEDRRAQEVALRFGRDYVASWPDVVEIAVLVGVPGSGKGHWLWSVVKAVVEQHGVGAEVVKLADMIRALRSGWNGGEDSELRVLRRFRQKPLLAIDEVSRHAFYGQQIHQHLYDVLDYRIEHGLPTILTSNEDEAGLREILKPAIFNRLELHGQVIDFGTASWRSRRAVA